MLPEPETSQEWVDYMQAFIENSKKKQKEGEETAADTPNRSGKRSHELNQIRVQTSGYPSILGEQRDDPPSSGR